MQVECLNGTAFEPEISAATFGQQALARLFPRRLLPVITQQSRLLPSDELLGPQSIEIISSPVFTLDPEPKCRRPDK